MDNSSRSALVTGAGGFIGGALARRLADDGWKVRGTVHLNGPRIADDRVEYLTADLRVEADCRRAVEGVDHVFMCAGSTSGAAVIERRPLVHVTPNVIMNTLMLQAAYEAGVTKFVWLSSTTGYPETGDRPVREDEMFDGHPYDKYFFVGWMKRFTELLCEMYGRRIGEPMATVVLRPTNVYGPGDDFDPATSHVTAALIRKVVQRQQPLKVWGTGDDVRDLLYIDDMVEAIVRASDTVEGHDAFNIGLGRGYSVKEVLATILDIEGWPDAPIVYEPDRPSMIPVRLVNTDKAEQALGFRPSVGLREGLTRTIAWYRNAGRQRFRRDAEQQ